MGGVLFRIATYSVVFLLCVAILTKARSRSVRQGTLLLASYGLYLTWTPWFAAVLFASTLVNYLVGRWLRRRPSGFALSGGILFNLALLVVFKYLPDAAPHFPFSSLQTFAHLVMPVGLSFWTFQAASYLFDVYQGEDIDPTLPEFALYMAFFPVTISGPVCRMPDMLPQFRADDKTRSDNIAQGLRRIAIGVLMMQLARLMGQGILAGDGIDSGFDRATQWTALDVWCLAFGYGLQLFFDFAGYSHIAIGAAQALGFAVPENFARPFESTSPSMFWTRWHMSLSFWIRDYMFFPIMQMRREVWWRNLALLISMVLFGLWHKATILFLLWGAYHGVLLVLHRVIEGLERKYDWTPPEVPWTAVSWITTISLVSLGWVFFRANSLPKARQMIAAVLSPSSYSARGLNGSLYVLVFALALGYGLTLFVADKLKHHCEETDGLLKQSRAGFFAPMARWQWYWIPPLYVLTLIFLLFMTLTRGASTSQFMYGNF
ncbi:MAG TPA: MBOAT family O-acyltransferase [Terriglobales bacterium]|nr:MBOAT family O-acyltransferase [Terriglobales bacterium]